MAKQTDRYTVDRLARGLAAVAARMSPKDAAEAARALTGAMAKQTDPQALDRLARGLEAVAERLGPREAAEAARDLTAAMAKRADPRVLDPLARGLTAVAERLGPQGAAEAARALPAAMAKQTDPSTLLPLGQGLSAVAARLDPREAAPALTGVMARRTPAELPHLEQALWSCLSADPRRPASRAAALVGSTAGFPWPGPPLAGLALLPPNLPPCRVSTQELVELLKLPTCVGPARRVVLDQLEGRYGRRFADHWDFVRFARAHDPGLDLTSPPKQPEPTAVVRP
jgi:hypothetical protein